MARIKSSDKTNRKLSTAPLSGVVDVMNTNAAIKLSVSSFLNKDKQAFPTGLQALSLHTDSSNLTRRE